jgi:Cu-Zn family superoxide dismutase
MLDRTRANTQISGLSPNSQHGFHVHEFGDLSSGLDCLSTGPHFNPFKRDHGAPKDHNRHVGDLGNLQTDASGVAKIDFTDRKIRLHGERNIVGRGIVVHANIDDLGRGGESDSKTTGHAGARAGCGVIGVANVTAINTLD